MRRMTSRRVKFGLLPAREYVASGYGRSARVDRAVLPALAAYHGWWPRPRLPPQPAPRQPGLQAHGPDRGGAPAGRPSGMPSLVSLPPSIRLAVGRSAAADTIRVAVGAGRSVGAGSGTLGPGLLTVLPSILGRQVWRAPGPGRRIFCSPLRLSQYPTRHPSQFPTRQF